MDTCLLKLPVFAAKVAVFNQTLQLGAFTGLWLDLNGLSS
jgi:hypothetical protein